MGRTAAVENYTGMYAEPEVYGNVVRKPQPASYRRRRSSAQALCASKALKKQKALFVAVGSVISVVVIGLSVVLLWSMASNNNLALDVEKMETRYNNLLKNNEDREFSINMNVDTNYVINAAIDIGMVRSNASQIVTYGIKNSEYLQQVAKVPEQ